MNQATGRNNTIAGRDIKLAAEEDPDCREYLRNIQRIGHLLLTVSILTLAGVVVLVHFNVKTIKHLHNSTLVWSSTDKQQLLEKIDELPDTLVQRLHSDNEERAMRELYLRLDSYYRHNNKPPPNIDRH